MVTNVLACSVILQLTAAVMAFRLIRLTGSRTAWSLIATALVLMSARRAIPLYHLLSGNSAITPDLFNELLGLVLSALMVLGVAGIAPLFSEIRRSNKALLESEGLYRTVLENTGTATVLIEEDTIITYANAEFERLSKCLKQDIEGKKSWTEFVVKEDLDGMRSQHLLRRENREVAMKQYEFRFVTKDGDIRNILLSIDMIPDTKKSVASLLDITDRKRVENIIEARSRLLEFADLHSMDELLTATLDELEALTGSSVGFYHFVESDQETLSLQNWSTNTMKYMCTAEGKGKHYGVAKAGVWADCVRERRPVVHNDYLTLPHRKGMPEGHAAVVRELTVPILRGNLIKAIIGVGNKFTAYSESDIEIVSQLGDLSWDVTERKRAEEALIASEVRYRRLFESAKDGILILDAETAMIVDVNPFLIKLLGYSHEQFLGKAIWEVGFLNDTVANKYSFRKLQKEKYVRYDDLPLETSDGRQIEVEFVSNVYNVDHTRVIQCNIRDVTGRKLAKEALIASEIRYRRLFESAIDGILILDAETGMVVDVNPFLIEMLGYSHEQFLGKTIWEVGFLNDTVASKYNFRKLQQEKYVRYDDLPLKTFDGKQIDVEFVGHVYKVGDKQVFQCNIRDITDRKLAEFAQRESEQKLRATVYGSPIPQFVIDRDHRVVFWNKALGELTGHKTEDMVGADNYWSAFYKEKRPCMCDLLVDGIVDSIPEWYGAQYRKSRLVADAFEVTDFFPHLGDRGKWLFFTAVPIKDTEGDVIGAMETLEDVTGQIKAEMEIHQLNEDLERRVIERTAQLQAANKELEAFSYSVSHDLRAPLRALDGFSRILLEDYAPQLPDEAVGHLDRVRNGATHMGRLIDDLLRFSRLSRQPLEKQPVNLTALVEETWCALESEREGRQVELVTGSLPDCQGDPMLLKQVFLNLLGNALKYSRHIKNARIEVGCLPQVVKAGEPPATNVYFVRDNGVGFDMQFVGKLFGVFQRLHRQDEYEGTGVGLAIVHRIVTRHGGKIWAESEPDKGATFYLTIGDTQVISEPVAVKTLV